MILKRSTLVFQGFAILSILALFIGELCSDAGSCVVVASNASDTISVHQSSQTEPGVAASFSSITPHHDKCGIYLAPSTIPGAGMGMFAGHRNFAKGDYLADGDLVIPAYDMKFHAGHNRFSFLWDEYTWKAASFSGMKEEVHDVKDVKACSPGFGAAVNCILPMVNVKDDFSGRTVSMSGVNASSSPGAGAFTIYHNRRWKAKREIPAGMELYGNYGSGYFRTRPEYGPIPLHADYRKADELLTLYKLIVKDHDTESSWKLDLLNILTGMKDIWDDSRTMHAIPNVKDMATIDWLLAPGRGSGFQHYNTSIRSLEWLDENGRCMDNIHDGVSTIPHAGRGAFASRFIPEGAIVAPAPLIQIPDREIFTIYAEKNTQVRRANGKIQSKNVADRDKPVHHQLLLNYCFGHRESTLLLCPYGLLTSNINHDGQNPNTKIQWAAETQMAYPEWREQPIDKWGKEEKAGLSFDFVALRDIAPGEEITVDYGDEWSISWEEHKRHFTQSSLHKRKYIPAFELNDMYDLRIPTIYEEDMEHTGISLFCHEDYLRLAGVLDVVKNENDATEVDWLDKNVYPCRILDRITTNSSAAHCFIAEVFERREISVPQSNDGTSNHFMTIDSPKAILFGLPRDAFYFADKVYERPHHQHWSFRHDMRIPDEIFPDPWRNRKTQVNSPH
jgi:hypothetical protein